MVKLFDNELIELSKIWNNDAVEELERGKERLMWLMSLDEYFQTWVSSLCFIEGTVSASPLNKSFRFSVVRGNFFVNFSILYYLKRNEFSVFTQGAFTESETLFFQRVCERMNLHHHFPNLKEWDV